MIFVLVYIIIIELGLLIELLLLVELYMFSVSACLCFHVVIPKLNAITTCSCRLSKIVADTSVYNI